MSGFNWLSYFSVFNPFQNIINSYNNGAFEWFKNNLEDWYSQTHYIEKIKDVALAIGSVMGTLPVPIVFLMSVGFSITIALVVVRIIIDLL